MDGQDGQAQGEGQQGGTPLECRHGGTLAARPLGKSDEHMTAGLEECAAGLCRTLETMPLRPAVERNQRQQPLQQLEPERFAEEIVPCRQQGAIGEGDMRERRHDGDTVEMAAMVGADQERAILRRRRAAHCQAAIGPEEEPAEQLEAVPAGQRRYGRPDGVAILVAELPAVQIAIRAPARLPGDRKGGDPAHHGCPPPTAVPCVSGGAAISRARGPASQSATVKPERSLPGFMMPLGSSAFLTASIIVPGPTTLSAGSQARCS